MDKHKFEGIRAYSIGAIESVSDEEAVVWRNIVNDKLSKWGMMVFDPTKKNEFSGLNEIGEERKQLNNLKNEGKWDEFNKIFKKIMHIDLRSVDHSDFVIAYMPKDIPVFGSVHEIVEARRQKKKVFVFTDCKKHEVNSWLLTLVGHENVFETLDEIFNHLETLEPMQLMYNVDEFGE